jgi:hypothetical protein
MPFENGIPSFLRENRMKQRRSPKSGMMKMLLTKKKCLCEFDLLFLKGILMNSYFATERKTFGKELWNLLRLYATQWGFTL